jgi:hypothetical protein
MKLSQYDLKDAVLIKKDHDLNKYVRIVPIIKFWLSMSFFDAI